jgi:hypothetical protein
MPLSSRDTCSAGMRSSWESASVENLGHADEWEQHAPQALQSKLSLARGSVKRVRCRPPGKKSGSGRGPARCYFLRRLRDGAGWALNRSASVVEGTGVSPIAPAEPSLPGDSTPAAGLVGLAGDEGTVTDPLASSLAANFMAMAYPDDQSRGLRRRPISAETAVMFISSGDQFLASSICLGASSRCVLPL